METCLQIATISVRTATIVRAVPVTRSNVEGEPAVVVGLRSAQGTVLALNAGLLAPMRSVRGRRVLVEDRVAEMRGVRGANVAARDVTMLSAMRRRLPGLLSPKVSRRRPCLLALGPSCAA